MKNWIGTFMVLACLTCAMQTRAGDLETYTAPEIVPEHGIAYNEQQKKLVMPFVGSDEEQGLLELFVGNAKQERENANNTSLTDDLNRISPAAGVQFRLEF